MSLVEFHVLAAIKLKGQFWAVKCLLKVNVDSTCDLLSRYKRLYVFEQLYVHGAAFEDSIFTAFK